MKSADLRSGTEFSQKHVASKIFVKPTEETNAKHRRKAEETLKEWKRLQHEQGSPDSIFRDQ